MTKQEIKVLAEQHIKTAIDEFNAAHPGWKACFGNDLCVIELGEAREVGERPEKGFSTNFKINI